MEARCRMYVVYVNPVENYSRIHRESCPTYLARKVIDGWDKRAIMPSLSHEQSRPKGTSHSRREGTNSSSPCLPAGLADGPTVDSWESGDVSPLTRGEAPLSAFEDAYNALCRLYPDPDDRGRAFERLAVQLLHTERRFVHRFVAVWLWPDWPYGYGPDRGIDLVAQRASGGFAAIQCSATDHITRGDLELFLAESKRPHGGQSFVERIVITTAATWSAAALTALEGLSPPVQRVDRSALEEIRIDWLRLLADDAGPMTQAGQYVFPLLAERRGLFCRTRNACSISSATEQTTGGAKANTSSTT